MIRFRFLDSDKVYHYQDPCTCRSNDELLMFALDKETGDSEIFTVDDDFLTRKIELL